MWARTGVQDLTKPKSPQEANVNNKGKYRETKMNIKRIMVEGKVKDRSSKKVAEIRHKGGNLVTAIFL